MRIEWSKAENPKFRHFVLPNANALAPLTVSGFDKPLSNELMETIWNLPADVQLTIGSLLDINVIRKVHVVWNELIIETESSEDWAALHPKIAEILMSHFCCEELELVSIN